MDRRTRAKVPLPYLFDESTPAFQSLQNWFNILANYNKLNDEMLHFLDDFTYSHWTAKSSDATRGIAVNARNAVDDNQDEGVVAKLAETKEQAARRSHDIRRALETLLHNYATQLQSAIS